MALLRIFMRIIRGNDIDCQDELLQEKREKA